jgi:DNA-binding MarR family transcriptional regulator
MKPHPLRELQAAVEVFRQATGEKDFPVQLLVMFLYVAEHDGCSQTDLVRITGMSTASVSRTLDWLGPEHRTGKPGLNLIHREVDPTYWKRYLLHLTELGKGLAARMTLALMAGAAGED